MIFVTGDTHGQHDFEKIKFFVQKTPNLNKNDYLIIAGDFGGVWDVFNLNRDLLPYKSLPCTVLFVDGNHENFHLLNNFPVENWNGGKVHRVADSIIHLMRGQVYTIDGKTFFTFGGATSIDKLWRIKDFSWWEEENPTKDEFNEAVQNLNQINNKVDYIITHSCDEKALGSSVLKEVCYEFTVFPENRMFSYFEENVKYGHWYFGHYHTDGHITENKTVLYNKIIEL